LQTEAHVTNQNGPDERGRFSPWLGAVALLVLTFAAHFPALRAGFLWDDEVWLWNSEITQASDGLLQAWTSTARFDYYPLTSSAFWIAWRLFGDSAAGYHALNLGLHALGVLLLWLLLRRLEFRSAWVAAAVFAVHPVTVATVAWISELKSTLSFVFCVLAALAFFRSLGPQRRAGGLGFALTLLAFAAAVLSKASAVVLPVVLLLLARWRRWQLGKWRVPAFASLFTIALAAGLLTLWFQQHRVIGYEDVRPEGLLSRVAAAGWAVWFYLGKALLPMKLAIVYARWDVNARTVAAWLPLFALAVVLVGSWRLKHNWARAVLFALGVYIVILLPVLGLLTTYYARYSLVADHWQYLALPAVVVLVTETARALLVRCGGSRRWGAVAGVAVLVVLSVLTYRQASCYESEGTFWRTVLARNPGAWVAQNGLGSWYGRQGKDDAALECFEEAIRLKPDYAMAHDNLGLAWERRGDLARARASFARAVDEHPTYADAHANLGRVLAKTGDLAGGIAHLREAVRLRPALTEAHFDLAVALTQTGQLAEAAEQLRRVTILAPERADAHDRLARLLYRLGDREGALASVREVVRLRPGDLEAQAVLRKLEEEVEAGRSSADSR
jgi:tetratricopeptide (TPR) repeat protein